MEWSRGFVCHTYDLGPQCPRVVLLGKILNSRVLVFSKVLNWVLVSFWQERKGKNIREGMCDGLASQSGGRSNTQNCIMLQKLQLNTDSCVTLNSCIAFFLCVHFPEQLLFSPLLKFRTFVFQGEPGNKGPDGDPVCIALAVSLCIQLLLQSCK